MIETTEIPGMTFLQFVMDSLVEEKDELRIDGKIDEQGVLLSVQVSAKDMGKLIGKGGQTVKALRTLLRIIGGNLNQRINLKVIEPDETAASPL